MTVITTTIRKKIIRLKSTLHIGTIKTNVLIIVWRSRAIFCLVEFFGGLWTKA
jgi:hypothetical protein